LDGESIGVLVVFASLLGFAGLGVGIAAARRRQREREAPGAPESRARAWPEEREARRAEAIKWGAATGPTTLADLARHFGVRATGDGLSFEREGVPVDLVIERVEGSEGQVYEQTTLAVGRDLAPIAIEAEGMRKSGDVETGDGSFDGVARIHGDPSLVLALCDPETRRRMSAAVLHGWSFTGKASGSGSRAVIKRSGSYLGDMVALITEAVALAKAFVKPDDLGDRLMRRLGSETLASVRIRIAAHMVAARDRESQLTGLLGADDAVRLLTATRLAAPRLWATLPEEALTRLLGHEDTIVVLTAVSALERLGTAESVPALNVVAADRGPARAAARSALAAIRARAVATPGALALSDSEAGLALVDEP
jgi:hypothetical protein